MTSNINSVDDSTLRTAIQQRLRANGVYDEITARVRSSLLLSLLNTNDTAAQPELKAKHTLQDLAWQSLVYHFLGKKNFVHSLSVFTAECGLESGSKMQLSLEDSIKALGLGRIWEQHKKLDEEGIDVILKTVTQWLSSGNFNSAPATRENQTITVSVQTETVALSNFNSADNKENQHNSSSNKSMEQRLKDIELDLRHEMNEKLCLSAKKHALNATKRCEEKFKNEIEYLKQQIDQEKAKSKQIENHWEEKLLSRELSMEKKHKRLTLERDTLESDVMMLKEHKNRQMREWTNKQDELEGQKHRLQSEINEVLRQREEIKATEIMCASLQDEKESWLDERKELLDEIKLLRNQLASLHKTKDMIHQSCAQIKAEQVKSSQEYRMKQNLLERQNVQLESQVQTLDETNRATRLQLERTKSEVTSLRSLLRQSQSALESVSFRDKETRVTDFRHSTIYRSSKSSHHSISTPLPSTPAPRSSTSSSSKQAPCIDRTSCSSHPASMFFKQCDGSDMESNEPLNTSADTPTDVHNHTGKDPPVLSPKDPPTVRSVTTNIGHHHMRHPSVSSYKMQVVNTVPPNNSRPDSVGTLIHKKGDDNISAISEITSRQDLAKNDKSSVNADVLIVKTDAIACSPTQDCVSDSAQTETKEHQNFQGSNFTADEDNVAENSNAGISATSAVCATNTTYSESFCSDMDVLKTVSKEENDQNADVSVGQVTSNVQTNDNGTPDNHSYETNESLISCNKSEPNHTPRSISSTSSCGGYTASFCTED